jgi:excisionase family DNA binding protein
MARVGIAEAAQRLGVSVDSIRRRIRKGELPAQRDNRGQWWLELVDDMACDPAPVSMQDRLAPLGLAPAQVPMLVPAQAADTALADALRAQVADLVERLDRTEHRLSDIEADRRTERAAWQSERDRLMALVESLAAPRPGLLERLVDAVQRRRGKP